MIQSVVLECPHCGCENIHMVGVVVSRGHDRTTVSHLGTVVEPTDRHKTHRGSEVVIEFQCEGGCGFRYSFEFHKGETTAKVQMDTQTEVRCDLWRD